MAQNPEGDLKERGKALDMALGQIERQFGKGSIVKLGDDDYRSGVGVVPTGRSRRSTSPSGSAVCREAASSRSTARRARARRRSPST